MIVIDCIPGNVRDIEARISRDKDHFYKRSHNQQSVKFTCKSVQPSFDISRRSRMDDKTNTNVLCLRRIISKVGLLSSIYHGEREFL